MTDPVEAAALVENFLRAMENRDLAAASTMMAKDAKIVFPGRKVFRNQEEMVAAACDRYQWIKKKFECFETAVCPKGGIVVYVLGTLYGRNNFEADFEGVRYIDRFVVENGTIVSQEVWNDLAESGVLSTTS